MYLEMICYSQLLPQAPFAPNSQRSSCSKSFVLPRTPFQRVGCRSEITESFKPLKPKCAHTSHNDLAFAENKKKQINSHVLLHFFFVENRKKKKNTMSDMHFICFATFNAVEPVLYTF